MPLNLVLVLVLLLIATKVEAKEKTRAKVYTGKQVTTSTSSILGVSLIQCQTMCVLAIRKGTSNICGYDKVSKTCFYSFDTEDDVINTPELTKVVLIPVEDTCQSTEYLVNGTEPVSDDQITASSVYDGWYDPGIARLHSVRKAGAWAPPSNNINQYIQVQFNCLNYVVGVALQGRPGGGLQFVTTFKVLYSRDCVNFLTIKDTNGTDVIFDGNTDRNTVVTSMLPSQVTALCVRINPVTWHGWIALRFDILGCPRNNQ
ncbi:lactadherin-like [Mya arenaria]|uniref:lactadherin-like n=1 Tax=Mya arenaria TaxID=6604 RepID=UPI0022E8A3CC|nr:lactadherin-like [Mya arenaria]